MSYTSESDHFLELMIVRDYIIHQLDIVHINVSSGKLWSLKIWEIYVWILPRQRTRKTPGMSAQWQVWWGGVRALTVTASKLTEELQNSQHTRCQTVKICASFNDPFQKGSQDSSEPSTHGYGTTFLLPTPHWLDNYNISMKHSYWIYINHFNQFQTM